MVLATLGLILVPSAAAQLSVDQLSMVLPAAPGESRLGVLTVRNDGSLAAQANISLEDWDRAEDGANRFHPLGTVPGSCGASVSVFPTSISIDPGEEQAIRISLDSASSMTRECWVLAVVEKIDPPPSPGTGVTYRMRMATKIYVQPPGLPLLANIKSMRVGRTVVAHDSVTGVEVVLENTGGRHLEGKGSVQVRRPDNTLVETIALPVAYALAGATVRVRASFPSLPPGRYVLLALMDYGGAELAAAQIEHIVP